MNVTKPTADPGRSVAADSPGNPPIRSVCLPCAARGYSPGRGDNCRAAVAGSFNSGKNDQDLKYLHCDGPNLNVWP